MRWGWIKMDMVCGVRISREFKIESMEIRSIDGGFGFFYR